MTTARAEPSKVAINGQNSGLVGNFIATAIARILDIAGNLAVILIITRYLSLEDYGRYGFIVSFVTTAVTVTYFGLEIVSIREMACDREAAPLALGNALTIRWGLSGAVFIFILASIPFLHLSPEGSFAVFIVAVTRILIASSMMYQAVFKAFERMEYDAYITIFFQAVNLSFIAVACYLNLGFLFIFYSQALASVLRFIAVFVVVRGVFIKPVFHFDRAKLGAFFKYTYIMGLIALSMACCNNMEIFFLKYLADNEEVSLFYAPYSILSAAQFIPTVMITSFFPVMSRMIKGSEEEKEKLIFLFSKICKLLTMGGLLGGVVCFSFSNQIIDIIFGTKYDAAGGVFSIVSLNILFTFLLPLFSLLMAAANKEIIVFFCSLVTIALKVPFDLWLIPAYGNLGAGIAYAAGSAFYFFLILYFAFRHVFTFSFFSMLAKSLVSALSLAAGFFLFKGMNITLSVIAGIVFCTITLFFSGAIDKEDIDIFKKIVLKKGEKLG